MRQYLCDLIWGFTSEIEGEDPNNYTGFLLIHDKLAINILISVGLDQFGNALSKSLSKPQATLMDLLTLSSCANAAKTVRSSSPFWDSVLMFSVSK